MKLITVVFGLSWIALGGVACENRGRTAARQDIPPADSRPSVGGDSLGRSEGADPSSGEFDGTAGIVEKLKPGASIAVLRAVRTARQSDFDRIVFEFEGADLPGYHLEYVDRPVRQCGSGEVVTLAGDGWLEVRFTPAQAHTDAGDATVKEREVHLDLPVLKELELTCDFEAHVTWALGLASPNRFRVLELADPARLVVDVKH